jgi:NAD-dependent dihydropyrimidine dehydrogenase PreA subunit
MSTPMVIDETMCTGCGQCMPDCPKGSIRRVSKHLVSINEGCVGCQICAVVCPEDAVRTGQVAPGTAICDFCPVHCQIPLRNVGACHRFRNEGGLLKRVVPLHVFDRSKIRINPINMLPDRPLVTGFGAGTNRQLAPAKIIAQDVVEGVEVVTAVTEAVLSFSRLKVKLDVDTYIGDEGSPVSRQKKTVGYVTASEYGSRTLSVGDVTLLKGPHGHTVARTMTELANKKRVRLKVKGGSRLEIAVNQVPTIDGHDIEHTSFGCGSSIGKLFSHHLLKHVDDCIMLDMGVSGQMAYHHATIGAKPTGIKAFGKMSTPGRYMVPSGKGWGGTCIINPRDAIAEIDKDVAWPGLRVLVTETKAEKAAYFILDEQLEPIEHRLTKELQELMVFMRTYRDPSRANVLYVGGLGGGVRGALHPDHSPEVVRAVKDGRIKLTAAGQETFVFPGGNLVFMVDVGQMPDGCFAWVPTPATVIPIEFSMTRATYDAVCGYPEAVIPLEKVLEEFEHIYLQAH